MSPQAAVPEAAAVEAGTQTANDRFKKSFGNWFWGSMIAATVLHFMVFALWPQMQAEDISFNRDDMKQVDLPPEIEVPPPPEQIARPARPVISETVIDEDITIAPTTFEENPVEDLPPPPQNTQAASEGQARFTPFTVEPRMTNSAEVQRALVANYPPLLKNAGIGGTVNVWFHIDENGNVIDTEVNRSSGHPKLDEAALDVANVAEFAPALNLDKKVAVWVTLDITFEVNN